MQRITQPADLERLKKRYEQLKQTFNTSLIIAMMREYGTSYTDIAKVLGISRQAARQLHERTKAHDKF